MPTAKHSQYKSVHEAVKAGDVKALEALVKEGASVNEVDDTRDRFTPIHWAAHTGSLECLHWLLWHGADSSVATPKGWTPAHVAAIRGQDACIQCLEDSSPSPDGTLVPVALSVEKLLCLKVLALANNGVNLCAKDGRGSTPTHLAAAHGNTFTLHSLLRSGVEVNAMDKNSWSAVHSAAFHGRLGCLQLLLRWGGTIDDTDNLGNTPAHLAAMEGHLSCVKFLIGEGRNSLHILSARNNNGDTPKMLAHQFYKTKVVEYITNLEWERDHPEEAQNLAFPAHVAAYTGDISHLRMLVENQVVNINERDDKGSTLAHKAAGQGHLDVLQWLIEMGADVKLTNQAGETPKDVARRFARLAAVRMLGPSVEDEAETDAADKPEKKRREGRRRRNRKTRDDDDDEEQEEEEEEEEEDVTIDEDESDDDQRPRVEQTKEEEKESRGRAKKKMEELERLLEIATRNYVQLGGDVRREKKKEKEESEMKRRVVELETQLEYEMNRRERLEAQLDDYKLQVAHLHAALDEQQMRIEERLEQKKPTKKRSSSTSRDNNAGHFVRRTDYKAK